MHHRIDVASASAPAMNTRSRKRAAEAAEVDVPAPHVRVGAPDVTKDVPSWTWLPCEIMYMIANQLQVDDYRRLASVDIRTRSRLLEREPLLRLKFRGPNWSDEHGYAFVRAASWIALHGVWPCASSLSTWSRDALICAAVCTGRLTVQGPREEFAAQQHMRSALFGGFPETRPGQWALRTMSFDQLTEIVSISDPYVGKLIFPHISKEVLLCTIYSPKFELTSITVGTLISNCRIDDIPLVLSPSGRVRAYLKDDFTQVFSAVQFAEERRQLTVVQCLPPSPAELLLIRGFAFAGVLESIIDRHSGIGFGEKSHAVMEYIGATGDCLVMLKILDMQPPMPLTSNFVAAAFEQPAVWRRLYDDPRMKPASH